MNNMGYAIIIEESGNCLTTSSLEEAEKILDQLHTRLLSEKPTLATVEKSPGDILLIGLGHESWSVLSFVPASGDPSYYTTVNDYDTTDEKIISFYFGNQWTEIAREHLITYESARNAMTWFMLTGKLSETLIWKMD